MAKTSSPSAGRTRRSSRKESDSPAASADRGRSGASGVTFEAGGRLTPRAKLPLRQSRRPIERLWTLRMWNVDPVRNRPQMLLLGLAEGFEADFFCRGQHTVAA